MNVGDRVIQVLPAEQIDSHKVYRRGVITHDSHGVEALVKWDGGYASMELYETLRLEQAHADDAAAAQEPPSPH